jgi:heme O synthase-like polyprenyltransferase
MVEYLRNHWRGNCDVRWSLLGNGILAYVIALVVVTSGGYAIGANGGNPFVRGVLAGFAAVLGWWLVGTVRASLRTRRNPKSPLRVFSVSAQWLVVTFVVLLTRDIFLFWPSY